MKGNSEFGIQNSEQKVDFKMWILIQNAAGASLQEAERRGNLGN